MSFLKVTPTRAGDSWVQAKGGSIERERHFLLESGGLGGGAGAPRPRAKGTVGGPPQTLGTLTVLQTEAGLISRGQVWQSLPTLACTPRSCPSPGPVWVGILPSVQHVGGDCFSQLPLLPLRPRSGCFQICLGEKGRKQRTSFSQRPPPREAKPQAAAPSSSPVAPGMRGLCTSPSLPRPPSHRAFCCPGPPVVSFLGGEGGDQTYLVTSLPWLLPIMMDTRQP